MSEKSKAALKKQKMVFIALLVGVGMLILGLGYLFTSDKSYTPAVQQRPRVDLPADKVNPQDMWMNRMESQNTLIDQKIKYLEEIILQTKKQEENIEKEKRDLKQEIAQLKRQLKETAEIVPQPILGPSFHEDPLFVSPELVPLPICPPLVEICMEEPMRIVGNVEKTIPAGTTVKALLVSSVDADCGVYSNSDPIPVKLRLLDDGHLPKCVEALLKGGIIIGSAFGNLSSERVYMRLERLTQVNPDGSFIETEIAGYVSGEDGKYGVRGTVVDKSEKIIANAAISGLFGEASQVLQSAVGRYRIQNLLNTSQAVNDPFVPGGSSGSCNAFDMLADYYIKRAEQVKPVIQVSAGRIVDITFTHGTDVGDLHTQRKIQDLREKSRCLQ